MQTHRSLSRREVLGTTLAGAGTLALASLGLQGCAAAASQAGRWSFAPSVKFAGGQVRNGFLMAAGEDALDLARSAVEALLDSLRSDYGEPQVTELNAVQRRPSQEPEIHAAVSGIFQAGSELTYVCRQQYGGASDVCSMPLMAAAGHSLLAYHLLERRTRLYEHRTEAQHAELLRRRLTVKSVATIEGGERPDESGTYQGVCADGRVFRVEWRYTESDSEPCVLTVAQGVDEPDGKVDFKADDDAVWNLRVPKEEIRERIAVRSG